MPERAASLNYHHLLYFWLTAREGSLTAASERLGLAPSTLSSQIKALEDSVGHQLFQRHGRRLVITERGRVVARYADGIFGLGSELVDVLRADRRSRHPRRIVVGADRSLPKLLVCHLLWPLLDALGPVHLTVRHDAAEVLATEMTVHRLDLMLSDAPVRLTGELPLRSTRVGESAVAWMAHPDLARSLEGSLPGALNEAPMLLPDRRSTLRRVVEEWLEQHDLEPRIVAELEDSSLLKAFGGRGAGVFPIPDIVSAEVAAQYGVERLGAAAGTTLRFYLTCPEGREEDATVRAVLAAAGTEEEP